MNNNPQDAWWLGAYMFPWKKAFAASCFWYQETGSLIALWSMAHSLVCYQSCSGWDCGQSYDVDILPDGFPDWPYYWPAQPTFLFYLFAAVGPFIENITVDAKAHQRSWGDVKVMYR